MKQRRIIILYVHADYVHGYHMNQVTLFDLTQGLVGGYTDLDNNTRTTC